MNRFLFLKLIVVPLFCGACAVDAVGVDDTEKLGADVAALHELKGVTQERRAQYIRTAQIWTDSDIPSKNILRGPVADDSFALNEDVFCEFIDFNPDVPLGGKTRKFECNRCTDETCIEKTGEKVRVKYAKHPYDSGDPYAEVLSSRLLWALGFYADRVYPVRVHCSNCPRNPWSMKRSVFNFSQKPSKKGRSLYSFPYAIIKRIYEGPKIEVTPEQGISFAEMDWIDESAGGASPIQVDALRLLAAFMNHTDNKGENQRLSCKPGEVTEDGRCNQAIAMIHDLGITFSGGGFWSVRGGFVNLKEWSSKPIWKDRSRCKASLKNLLTAWYPDSLHNPVVTNEARAFLYGLLIQLTDQQLVDLFTVSRVAERGGKETVSGWVDAFKAKREELRLPCGE